MAHPVPSNPLRWFPEFLALTRRRIGSQARLLGLAVLVGIIAGLGAVVFSAACQIVVHYALDIAVGYRPEGPVGEALLRWGWLKESDRVFNPWLLLLIAPLGGLLSGWLVFTYAPEAEGHGTDAVIAAYHSPNGRIRPRVPIIKTIASAVTIGTGGSGGREGPIAQIGAGFGSFLADLLRLRPTHRRILMAAGMGAGIAAIFRAPLAGALFAAEVLYWSPEFEPEVIMPAGVASVVSYCTFGIVFGYHSLFQIDPQRFHFENAWQLIPYFVLALCMVVLAMIYTRSFYGFTHLFHRLPIDRRLKPALGAFLTVVVGLALYFLIGDRLVLSVLSFGYGVLQKGLNPHTEVTVLVLLTVAFGKIITTGLTIGSGGSGGVFGPSMVIGGCGGGAIGLLFQTQWPGLDPGSFVIVGMAAFFAAAAKTPFSTLVIVSEMTGDYNLILPTLWVCTFAFLLSDDQSLYRSQVESRSRSPAHQGTFVRQALAGVTLGSFLKSEWNGPWVRAGDPLPVVMERFLSPDTTVLPVVDLEQRLLGVISMEELIVALQADVAQTLLLATDLMRPVKPLKPNDTLERAQELFVENDLPALPVIDPGNNKRLMGMVRRYEIANAYLQRLHAPRVESAAENG
jgi:CIC family chloride channel protein